MEPGLGASRWSKVLGFPEMAITITITITITMTITIKAKLSITNEQGALITCDGRNAARDGCVDHRRVAAKITITITITQMGGCKDCSRRSWFGVKQVGGCKDFNCDPTWTARSPGQQQLWVRRHGQGGCWRGESARVGGRRTGGQLGGRGGQDWKGKGGRVDGELPTGDPGTTISLHCGQGRALVWGLALSGSPWRTVHWGLHMMLRELLGQSRTAWELAWSAHGGWCTQGAVGRWD